MSKTREATHLSSLSNILQFAEQFQKRGCIDDIRLTLSVATTLNKCSNNCLTGQEGKKIILHQTSHAEKSKSYDHKVTIIM